MISFLSAPGGLGLNLLACLIGLRVGHCSHLSGFVQILDVNFSTQLRFTTQTRNLLFATNSIVTFDFLWTIFTKMVSIVHDFLLAKSIRHNIVPETSGVDNTVQHCDGYHYRFNKRTESTLSFPDTPAASCTLSDDLRF